MSVECPYFQVDAFTSSAFHGNPAAVVLIPRALQGRVSDRSLQSIAAENQLAETSFISPLDGEPDDPQAAAQFELRWFTPGAEVALCGHATLAAAAALQAAGNATESLRFHTRWSGVLTVVRGADGWLAMDFPADPPEAAAVTALQAPGSDLARELVGELPLTRVAASPTSPFAVYELRGGGDEGASLVRSLAPRAARLLAAHPGRVYTIVTARGPGVPPGALISSAAPPSPDAPEAPADFYFRNFCPWVAIDEDPVTGSACTVLAPHWAGTLGKTDLVARQLSARGGVLKARLSGDRVVVSGEGVAILHGRYRVPLEGEGGPTGATSAALAAPPLVPASFASLPPPAPPPATLPVPFRKYDVFAVGPFTGNPAAITLLPDGYQLDERLAQRVAAENNLPVTTFLQRDPNPVPGDDAGGRGADRFKVWWFSPSSQLGLCGHGSLAAATALRDWALEGGAEAPRRLTFAGPRGEELSAAFEGADGTGRATLELSAVALGDPVAAPGASALASPPEGAPGAALAGALLATAPSEPSPESYSVEVRLTEDGRAALVTLAGPRAAETLVAVRPDPLALMAADRGLDKLVLTCLAPGSDRTADIYVRNFLPWHGVDEDPATGSISAILAPFWASRGAGTTDADGRVTLRSYQASTRTARLQLTHVPGSNLVTVTGDVVPIALGEIYLPHPTEGEGRS